jgi:hypothetical protein
VAPTVRTAASRGALIGAAFSVAVVAQHLALGRAGTMVPAELRPLSGTALRWVTAAGTAAAGTVLAAGAYVVLWRQHRRGGPARREGLRVLLSGLCCYALIALANFWSRVAALGHGSVFDAAGAQPPLWSIAVLPVAVYSWSFASAGHSYRRLARRRQPAMVGSDPDERRNP